MDALTKLPAGPTPRDTQARFDLLIEAVTDYAIFMLDKGGYISSWNLGAQRIKGYTESEAIGKHFSIFYPPEDQATEKPSQELRTALEVGRFEDEGWRVRKDGSRFWANVVLTPMYDEQHQHIGFAKVTRDFSERKRLEETLRQSEERFRLLVGAVKDYAIFMLDPEGYVVSWNAGAEHAKGYTEKDILGKHFSIFYTAEDRTRNRPQELLRIAVELGHVEDEGWRVRKDGTHFWADVILTAIRDETGRLRGFTKVTRDLTERRQADIQLRESREQINKLQKIESIGRLAGGIAHDFNNLVAGILGCAEAVQEMIPTHKDVQEEVAQIVHACERARSLVRQLMAFSRRQLTTRKPILLNQVIQEMRQLIRRSLPAHIDIVWQLEPDLPTVMADVAQIEQIIMNLVLNARDAMPSGGTLTIQTSAEWLDEYTVLDGFSKRPAHAVRLSVSDTGAGMSKEVQEKMFEPFFTTKEVGKGSGLGLSTVYGIVQQNEGGIAVHSAPGFGTTLKIFLPSSDASEDARDLAHRELKGSADQLTGDEIILVVEDEPLVLRNTVRALQKLGYTVLSATNAEEGLKIFEKTQGKIQLMITDVIMPGKSGKELADFVQKADPNLKILFMSGYAAETIATHGIVKNEINFIEKPFNMIDLTQKIRQIFDR